MSRRDTGILGEELAQRFLAGKGYKILETNYRCPPGELDIIARDGDCLVFVEVRTKTGTGFGSPQESITAAKQRHLIKAAAYYCQAHRKLPPSRRIDVIAVTLGPDNKPALIEHIENAVSDRADYLW